MGWNRVTGVVAVLVVTAVSPYGRAAEPAMEATLFGEVIAVRVEGDSLLETPLEGAVVLTGRGILLDTGGDGRDTVVPADDPALRPAVELARTDEQGRFAVPLPPGDGPLDVLVWKPGYTPVLRQSTRPDKPVVFRLHADTPSQLHLSLTLPDGRLVLPALEDRAGLPFVDAGLGLLMPLPPGYRREGAAGVFTVAHFRDGSSHILVLRAPSRLETEDLAELLRQQMDHTAGAPRLVRAHDILLDGRRASWREFADGDERAAMVYATRRDASIVILFAAPAEEYEARVEAFQQVLAATRFLGGPPVRPDSGRRVRARGLGVELLIPKPWTVTREDVDYVAARLAEAGIEFQLRRHDGPEDPMQVAERAVTGLDTSTTDEPQWLLVGGAPGCMVASEGRDPSTGEFLFRRAVAVQADREVLLGLFSGPREQRGGWEAQMDAVLASIVFTGEK